MLLRAKGSPVQCLQLQGAGCRPLHPRGFSTEPWASTECSPREPPEISWYLKHRFISGPALSNVRRPKMSTADNLCYLILRELSQLPREFVIEVLSESGIASAINQAHKGGRLCCLRLPKRLKSASSSSISWRISRDSLQCMPNIKPRVALLLQPS